MLKQHLGQIFQMSAIEDREAPYSFVMGDESIIKSLGLDVRMAEVRQDGRAEGIREIIPNFPKDVEAPQNVWKHFVGTVFILLGQGACRKRSRPCEKAEQFAVAFDQINTLRRMVTKKNQEIKVAAGTAEGAGLPFKIPR